MTKTDEDFPVAVTLRFRSQEARDYFMSSVSDSSVGENDCSLDWPSGNWTEADNRSGKAFCECDTFCVTVFDTDIKGESDDNG